MLSLLLLLVFFLLLLLFNVVVDVFVAVVVKYKYFVVAIDNVVVVNLCHAIHREGDIEF